jgi:hypothetical protein
MTRLGVLILAQFKILRLLDGEESYVADIDWLLCFKRLVSYRYLFHFMI